MNKKGKLTVFLLTLAGVSATLPLLLCSCGKEEVEKSEIIGSFKSEESSDVIVTNDASLQGTKNGTTYIYSSDVYPLNTLKNVSCKYEASQKLRLKRDFTYEYTVQIAIANSDSGAEYTKLESVTYGTYTYEARESLTEAEIYTVTFSDPTSGTESWYGAEIDGEGSFNGWTISKSANYVVDYSAVGENYEYDRYVKGKTVTVTKLDTDRYLSDSNMFFTDFLSDMAPYCGFVDDTQAQTRQPEISGLTDREEDIGSTAEEQVKTDTLLYKTYGDYEIGLSVGDGLSIAVSAPKACESVVIDGNKITDGKEVSGKKTFAYPISLSQISGYMHSVTIAGKSFGFDIVPWLENLLATDYANIDPVKEAAKNAEKALAVNLLYIASEFSATDITLTDEQLDLVYTSADIGIISGDLWDDKSGGDSAGGFIWNNVDVMSFDGVTPVVKINFKATVNYNSVSAKVTIGGKACETAIKKTKENSEEVIGGYWDEGENKYVEQKATYNYYTVSVFVSDITFADMDIVVYDGEEKISSVGKYSLAQACAYASVVDGSSEQLKKQAVDCYSLLKSIAWFVNRNDTTYNFTYPTDTQAGSVSWQIGAFKYSVEVPERTEYSGYGDSRLVLDGSFIDETRTSYQTSSVNASKSGDEYSVTFTDAQTEAISTVGKGNLDLTIKGNSAVYNNGHRSEYKLWVEGNWDAGGYFVNYDGSLCTSDGNISISGSGILTLCGGIYANGNLTIDGTEVVVAVQSRDFDAVICKKLEIKNGGKLIVKYVGEGINSVASSGGGVSSKSGVYASGNVEVDGTLSVSGFACGVYLCGGYEQKFILSGGSVDISAVQYGISGSQTGDKTNHTNETNRLLNFVSGTVNIRTGSSGVAAVNFCDITVDTATVNIVAESGIGICENVYSETEGEVTTEYRFTVTVTVGENGSLSMSRG